MSSERHYVIPAAPRMSHAKKIESLNVIVTNLPENDQTADTYKPLQESLFLTGSGHCQCHLLMIFLQLSKRSSYFLYDELNVTVVRALYASTSYDHVIYAMHSITTLKTSPAQVTYRGHLIRLARDTAVSVLSL